MGNLQANITTQPGFSFRHKGFVLSPDDIVLLKFVYDYRYLQIEDLAELAGRGYRKVQERLVKLAEYRYLWRAIFPFRKHIYGIGNEGIPVLVQHGHASKENLTKRLRHHELTETFLNHTLMVVDIHKRLEIASRAGDIRLINWRDDRELRDKVSVLKNGENCELTVWPDAFFTLEDRRREEKNRARFFLEADRSTTAHRKFQDKILAYWEYFVSGKFFRRYQLNSFRVATITLTAWRKKELCLATSQVIPEKARKYFLFTSLEDLAGDETRTILSTVFMSPRDHLQGALHSLIPQPDPASAVFTNGSTRI
jgi:hypothetical protein